MGNKLNFAIAETLLQECGFKVFSPTRSEGQITEGRDPDLVPEWEYMSWLLPAVCRSDLLVVLPGWEGSRGARLEVNVATSLDIPVYRYDNGESVNGLVTTISRQSDPGDENDFVEVGRNDHEIFFTPETKPIFPADNPVAKILGEIQALHDTKTADYGTPADPFANVRASGEWGIPAWVGAMVRASDKVQRLKSFVLNGSVRNEPVRDSLLDLALYSIIALVLFEEKP